MPAERLTPARLALTVLYLILDDVDFDELLEHSGVPASRLDDMDGMLSFDDSCALIKSSLELTGDPALGLHMGQEIGIEMLDMVGMIVANAPDLRNALHMITEFSPLASRLGRIELQEGDVHSRLVLHLEPELVALKTHFCGEICAATFFCMARRLFDGTFAVRTLRSRLPAPPWAEEYFQVFGDDVEVLFEADEDSMEFDSALLHLRTKRHSPGLYQQLRTQAARRLASLPQPETSTGSVRRLIDEYLGEKLLDLPTIAERMGMTPRTLQRRLRDENITFQVLYDERRQLHARRYLLEDPNSNIDTLAAILGYSEPANFYRAFKTWFGLSPREFQRRHKADYR